MQPQTFALMGETLRRVRKERGKTLAQLAVEAKVGKGQLSRIETGKQEVTLGTLAKVLAAHRLSRQEFFHRYDLVEAEAGALKRPEERLARAARERPGSTPPGRWPDEIHDALTRLDAFVTSAAKQRKPVMQGEVAIGDFVVHFRIVPNPAGNDSQPEDS